MKMPESIPSVISNDIVSRTDSLAGPGRPCLLSPVNGRHLQWRLPYLAGTWIPGGVLGYLAVEAAHREGGTILSNLGKLSPRSIGQWLSEREPRSRSLGACIPAPSRQPEKESSKVELGKSPTVRTRPRFETRLSPPQSCGILSARAARNTVEHCIPRLCWPPRSTMYVIHVHSRRTAS